MQLLHECTNQHALKIDSSATKKKILQQQQVSYPSSCFAILFWSQMIYKVAFESQYMYLQFCQISSKSQILGQHSFWTVQHVKCNSCHYGFVHCFLIVARLKLYNRVYASIGLRSSFNLVRMRLQKEFCLIIDHVLP